MRIERATTVFEQLLNLYTREGLTVPLEDFTTEVLAGVLKSDQGMLDDFVHKMLHQDGGHWKVMTQVYYPLEDSLDCFVDMVFHNEDSIAFIENKVDSHLHSRQLERYERVLLLLRDQQSYHHVSLHYCTKRLEQIDDAFEVEFRSFRWHDIYKFFTECKENSLVLAFLQFLERNKLMRAMEFELFEMDGLKGLPKLLHKLDGMLEPVRFEMEKRFGPVKSRDGKQISQITDHGRYAISISPAFGGSYSDLTAGFLFDDEPSLLVQLWSNRRNIHSERFHRIIMENEELFDSIILKEKGWGFRFSLPLTRIFSEMDQYKAILQWMVERLDSIESFMMETEELEWDMEIKRSIIAAQGEGRYLVQLGGGRGQILDLFSGVINPPQNCDSILKMGYWEDCQLTKEEEKEILNTQVRMIKGLLRGTRGQVSRPRN
ncbi:PD-(D/E)XK nuclease family protein [Falsibacillus pallidus]|uniref:PD-(D/E)XK nuclease superfamily protein n=1 Tax=Falsibacillus pallidus TaxID=493781 RepID=A0A370FYE5_9BACI|nr:PD-(D/E)XK nuclease family protein [Falsibacillus pallidus]RDI36475.1 PD-(D/E)XK nuclease superfamily protein [Falsibacillus pallidus]